MPTGKDLLIAVTTTKHINKHSLKSTTSKGVSKIPKGVSKIPKGVSKIPKGVSKMPKGIGYGINAQKATPGKETTGASAVHKKRKPCILKGAGPAYMASCTDNKKMYKSKDGVKTSYKGKMSY